MAYTGPEPLRRKHDLAGFQSGEHSLDDWLRRYARTADGTGSAKVFVTTSDGTAVVGYYALAGGEVASADATVRLLKGQPADASVPVAILARLAVDESHQDKGLGEGLLRDALLRVDSAAEQIGIRALVAHALNEAVRDWYLGYGFEPSPTDELHLILLLKDLRKLLSSGDGSGSSSA